MSAATYSEGDIARLTRLAAVLIPGTAEMPAADSLSDIEGLIRTAIKACGYGPAHIRTTIDALPDAIDWAGAQAFAASDPAHFHIASTLASAAYYMHVDVLEKLGFPRDRRQPAEVEDFVDEYETGILDAVTERGPRYRDVRGTAQ